MKTVSLELAKQLKEAGYPQESYFEWFDYHGNFSLEKHVSNEFHGDDDKNYFAAPTADEILNILPNELIGDEGMRFDLNIYKGEADMWVVCYWWDEDSRRKSGMFIKNVVDKSLADAAAKQWLYLKKEGLLASDNGEFAK